MIAGIDLGNKRSAIAWRTPEGQVRYGSVEYKTPKRPTAADLTIRVFTIASRLVGMLRMCGASVVAIEGYAYGAKDRGMVFNIAELGGAMKYALYRDLGLTPQVIPPSQARMLALGDGSLTKQAACDRVRAAIHASMLDDECDAYVVMRAAEVMAGSDARWGMPECSVA